MPNGVKGLPSRVEAPPPPHGAAGQERKNVLQCTSTHDGHELTSPYILTVSPIEPVSCTRRVNRTLTGFCVVHTKRRSTIASRNPN